MTIETKKFARVVVPVPLYRYFDYEISEINRAACDIGARVKVPFANRELIGFVVELIDSRQLKTPENKIKPIIEVLDTSLLPADSIELASWVASYYISPIGMIYEMLLPTKMRKGIEALPKGDKFWRISNGLDTKSVDLGRAKKQQLIFDALLEQQFASHLSLKKQFGDCQAVLTALEKKGIVEKYEQVSTEEYLPDSFAGSALDLNQQQKDMVAKVKPSAFESHLLYGITGSGKTEVYLSIIENILQTGEQALLLVPEIALTPQFVDRVRNRLPHSVAVLHSALNDTERHKAWWAALNGKVDIVLGTRAAVFTSFKNLKMIIVDEEHDASFKQQDGVRYHARDVALMRAKMADIPIVMGSATPSLESWKNQLEDRFTLSELPSRATGQSLPIPHIVDVSKSHYEDEGLSNTLIKQIEKRLEKNQQVLLFINRRGFAPSLYCVECGHVEKCQRCNSHLTVHSPYANSDTFSLRCHHCGYQSYTQKTPHICSSCNQQTVLPLGLGIQKIQQNLQEKFPQANIVRFDRDVIQKKNQLEETLDKVTSGEADILLGTQMLVKGHDFPNVTMVGVIDADQGLFAADFRAAEKLFQQLMQVSGRAGRHQLGEVYIQTKFPDHEFFEQLCQQDYAKFSENELGMRAALSYPPHMHMSLLRAESVYAKQGIEFLNWCRQQVPIPENVFVSSPVPAPMEKRAGRYRAQMLFQSDSRKALSQYSKELIAIVTESQQQRQVRWSLDVDPIDLY